ncbi:MAG TPA: cytidylate kinase-like family protein [Candidatus Mediterraneibacter stercoripullorum]|nr:cytidylate kinase-like family protein [Candidatus Mediterraneibacter stercoripullorum]
MSKDRIITIGRQFGSGGHEIGQKLADRLGIPLYDNQLVSMAAKELEITEEAAQRADEANLNTFLAGYQANMLAYPDFISGSSYIYSLNEDVFRKQTKIIRELAGKGSCVIVGRCADYILRENPECINVFICAEKKDRVARISERYGVTEKKAAYMMRKTDRERAFYYESHTGLDWGSINSHQILFNVSLLGQERIVDILEMMFKS